GSVDRLLSQHASPRPGGVATVQPPVTHAAMADVRPFFQGAAFDDDGTQVMGKAFDRASQTLHDNGQPDLVRQIIAKRIIEVARNGERDPDELCARALQALAFVFAKSLDRAPTQFGAAKRGSLARP